MFSLFSTKILHKKSFGDSSTTLSYIWNSFLRFTSNAVEKPCSTVDYLIKRCGLTPESAIKASQRIDIKSTKKADAVLAILDTYGLPKPCISNLIRKDPTVLSVNLNKLLGKMGTLSNLGIAGPDLARILCRFPDILAGARLERQILPCIHLIKNFLHNDKNVVVALSRLRWIAGCQKIMEPNIEILRNQGVLDAGISKLLKRRPQLLTWKQPQFVGILLQTKEMGFDPSSLMFIQAVCTLSCMKNATFEMKLEVFRSFGWSEDEILCIFRKQAHCFACSAEVLKTRLDFFMNKLNWTAAQITKNPVLLLFSLEKRTFPRYSIIQILLSQGLMKKQSISTALTVTEDKFLENFVRKHHQELPQLLKEYKDNMGSLKKCEP